MTMRLIYVTLRRAQIPKSFYEATYPALITSLLLPKNYKAIRQPGLAQALEDVVERVKRKPAEVAIVTDGTGNLSRLQTLLDTKPDNLTVNLFTVDQVSGRRVQRLQPRTQAWQNIFFFDLEEVFPKGPRKVSGHGMS